MGLLDYSLLALIALAALLALVRLIRSRGSCSCGGSCAGCSMNCESKKK